ncbi:dipeptide ABC transporter ATP-binding protein [Cognatishimia sp. WU-CL00825]|uniref:ABC transporter ATP-binding protein n=1 Tax=Cognatishimia sp. WU-CL00825 TaxID=3127658 RepID=UPI0031062C16
MSEAILKVRNLNMHFPTGGGFAGKSTSVVRAVNNVSFEVNRGESFGIVGESGSGKTTLGRCIMRILAPTSGEMHFAPSGLSPVDLTSLSKDELRVIWRKMRMVFQDPQSSLNPRLRVLDLIGQSIQKTEGLRGTELSARVAELLLQVGLRPEFLMRYANAFSGGQRQRIGIARALATRPEMVIADEAVSALDVSIQAQTLNLMKDLQEDFALTYVFIAHDLAVVQHFCDRIAVMFQGQIVELAAADTLYRAPKHPYTRALLSAVPIPDPRQRGRLRGKVALTDGMTQLGGCAFAGRCAHATEICKAQLPPVRNIDGAEVACHFAGEI